MALPVTLDSLIHAVEASVPDDRLTQLGNASATAGELGELGDSLLSVFVDRCRREGHSWSEIGTALGVTKQAVQQRFVATTSPERNVVPLLGSAFLGPTLSRFTDRARRALSHAVDEARGLGHAYVGTEHLLLGLMDEPEGVAAVVLSELGASREGVITSLLATVARGTSIPEGDLPLTPRATRALELTLAEALKLGHNYVGTEHVLLGILREGDGLGARIVSALVVDTSLVEARIVEILSGQR